MKRIKFDEYRCEHCGKIMSESDVEDFGTLCEECYMKEYYPEENDYENDW